MGVGGAVGPHAATASVKRANTPHDEALTLRRMAHDSPKASVRIPAEKSYSYIYDSPKDSA